MRILYFHQHFSTPKGSAGTRSYEMSRALVGDGHEVTMVCGSYRQGNTGLNIPFNRGVRRGVIDGIDVIEFELTYANDMGFLLRTWVFLKFALRSSWIAVKEPADVIFATSTPLTAGIPGILARWITGRKFVFEVRDLWPELPRAMGVITNPIVLTLMSFLEWVSYKSAHKLIGLSPGIVEGIAKRGIKKSKIALIPNGCDLRLFSVKGGLSLPKQICDDDFVAIYAGTHGLANGLDAVLDAAALIQTKAPTRNIKILLVGQGKEKSRLQQRVINEAIENVVFLDSVPKDELVDLFNRADLGLQILRNVPEFYYGTSPNKFFDYLSAGLPVLNNYPGWVAALIEDFECGYTVPPDQPSLFAEQLIRASMRPKELKRYGENALRLARNKFARNDLGKSWVEWVTNA